MPYQFAQAVTRATYGVRQLPRLAWYIGHSLVLRELADTVRQSEKSKARRRRVHTDAPVPDRKRIYADMAKLFLRDLANVEAGIYPVPADHDGSLLVLVRRSQLFFEDLPNIHQRRKRRAHNEILNDATRGKRPRYYLQNFHYQSGGWMTDNSAELYDTQVEVLFNGSANAIRRQALPQLHEVFAGRDQRKLRLMDVGCGTGRFFDFVKQVWPRLPIFGIDMSEAYVKYAKGHLKHWSQIRLSVGKAEALPVRTKAKTRLRAYSCSTNCRRRYDVAFFANVREY